MYLPCVTGALPPVGFPIRKSPGQSLFSGSPKLIAAYRVLHRLSLPRHPPYALSSLTIKKLLINLLPCIPERQLRITNYELRIEFKPAHASRIRFLLPTDHFLCNCQRTVEAGVRGRGSGIREKAMLFLTPDPRPPTPEPCFLVEVNGIEPMTPCVQGRCSPS
jgi:hypothetical protein